MLWVLGGSLSRGADIVIADLGATRYPGNEDGYSGSLTLQQSGENGGVLLGAGKMTVPAGSLVTGNLDGYRIESKQVTLSAGLSIGDATTDARAISLYKARLAVDVQVNPSWSIRAADQYVDFDVIHGQVMSIGGEYRVDPRWGVKCAAGYALGGTAADRYGEIAVHWYGPEYVYAGIVAGRTGYDPATLGQIDLVRRLRQAYLGTSIPLRRATLNISADDLALDGQSRQTVHIGVTWPITS
jgi:hypothetical protein